MFRLLGYIRPAVYALALIIAIAIWLTAQAAYPSPALRDIHLTDAFALTALIFLYFALLASPLYSAFPHFPLRILYVKARKAIGNSAFFFACLHSYFAFFKLLGGFPGLGSLPAKYLIAITLSATALLILAVMALTSLRYFEVKLGRYWKPLHRLVYLAGLLIIIHALLLGRHFQDLSTAIPQIFFTALFILLALEAIRFHRYYIQKFPGQRFFSIVFFSVVGALAGVYLLIHIPSVTHIHLTRDPQSGAFAFSTDPDDENPTSLSRSSQFLGDHSWHLILFGIPFVVVFGIHVREKYRERRLNQIKR